MRSWAFLLWPGVFLFACLLVYLLGGTLLPFILGAAFAFIAIPMMERLAGWKLNRTGAALAATGIVLLVVVGLLALVVPLLVREIVALTEELPRIAERLAQFANRYAERWFGADGLGDLVTAESVGRLIAPAGEFGQWLLASVTTLFDVLLLFVLTPFVTFFLMRDWPGVLGTINSLLPEQSAPKARTLARDIQRQLAGFIRGQGLVCLAQAIFHSSGLLLIGLDFAILIGILTGLSALVPVIGNLVMVCIALTVAAVQFDSALPVGLVALVYGASQLLETVVLSPWLIGDRINLHPLWVVFALLAAGSLFGLPGALLALPGAAVAEVLVRHLIDAYRGSRLQKEA